jgi:hypothetical protein
MPSFWFFQIHSFYTAVFQKSISRRQRRRLRCEGGSDLLKGRRQEAVNSVNFLSKVH